MTVLNISLKDSTDGILSAHVIHYIKKDYLHVEHVLINNSYELPCINKDDFEYVIITNINLKQEHADEIIAWLKHGIKVIVIDYNSLPVDICKDIIIPSNLLNKFVRYHSDSISASLMTYLLLSDKVEFNDSLPLPITVYGDFDVLQDFRSSCIHEISNPNKTHREKMDLLYTLSNNYVLSIKTDDRSLALNEFIQYINNKNTLEIYNIFNIISNECISANYGYDIGSIMYDAKLELSKSVYLEPSAIVNAIEIFPYKLIKDNNYLVYVFNSPLTLVKEGSELQNDKCSILLSWHVKKAGEIEVYLYIDPLVCKINLDSFSEYFTGVNDDKSCRFVIKTTTPLAEYLFTCKTYSYRNKEQLKDWVSGILWHNEIDGECTPDFSCCNPGLYTVDLEKRLEYFKKRFPDISTEDINKFK